MAEIKLTKSELRIQQHRLIQLLKYLPTLQLKKAMLQAEVNEAKLEIARFQSEFNHLKSSIEHYSALISDATAFEPDQALKITRIEKSYENIAGVEVPALAAVHFKDYPYSLFNTPPWVDSVIQGLRKAAEADVRIEVATEKRHALEKELREVSIRVNLFEKILIPRAHRNIKKIKVFLGDQLLAAVSQAKIAKMKIIALRGHHQAENYAH